MRLRFLAVAVLLVVVVPQMAWANPRYAGLVIDAVSGEVFYEDSADAPRYPASLTKMMTLYMVFQELDAGRLTLGSTITFSRHADAQPASDLGLPAGATLTVEQAIYALVTRSANDVAAAVGEHIGGTESQFAAMMTQEAHRIGMTSTTFRNASGLPDAGQVTTARDMARLAQALLVRFPHYYHYFGTREWTFRGVTYTNHNRLLGQYPGMDGFKTGYIRASGFNLVASAQRGELRVIGVVFGGQTTASRNAHMVDLLDRAFDSARGEYLVAHGSLPFMPPLPDRNPRLPAAGIQVAALEVGGDLEDLSAVLADVVPPFQPPLPGLRPVASGGPVPVQVASVEPVALGPPAGGGDLPADAAAALGALSPPGGEAAFVLSPPTTAIETAGPVAPVMPQAAAAGRGSWGVQVGTFEQEGSGLERLQEVMAAHPRLLGIGFPNIVRAETESGVLYRARIYGISYEAAAAACGLLTRQGTTCLTLAPQ